MYLSQLTQEWPSYLHNKTFMTAPARLKRYRIALAASGVAVTAALVFFVTSRKAPPPRLQLETALVDRGRISARITATGTVSPVTTVQVGSQVSGRIQTLLVDFNSTVARGQLLARIDPHLFAAAERAARANLLAARANLSKALVQAADAGRQFARQRVLGERNLVAQGDIDTSETTAQAAKYI